MQKAQSAGEFLDEYWKRPKPKEPPRDPAADAAFLDAWKRESDKRGRSVILMSLPIRGPEISDSLKQEAIECIMRVVWFRVWEDRDSDEKGRALRANLDAIKRYTSVVVDKIVAENWGIAKPDSAARDQDGASPGKEPFAIGRS